MAALRRTRRRAHPVFAWRVQAGDLVHVASAVYEVLAITNGDRPDSRFSTTALVIDEDIFGREYRRAVRWRPQQELLVVRGNVR